MIVEQACAKINLSLDITGKRPNGYHDVRMIMQSLDLCDDLVFEKGEENSGITLVTDNEMLNKEQESGTDNLIVKAYKLLKEKTGKNFDVKITLSKRIPIAAGMAGGSADAAAALRGINRLFELNLSMDELREMAVNIGADVPFCIEGGLCLSEGIGEKLTVLTPLPSCPVVICKPAVFVSTGEVYKAFDSMESHRHPDVDAMLSAIEKYDAASVYKLVENILEPVTVNKHPVINKIEESLIEAGAENAIMTGSGPTVFGLFFSEKEAKEAADRLKEKYPDFEIHATKFKNVKKQRFE